MVSRIRDKIISTSPSNRFFLYLLIIFKSILLFLIRIPIVLVGNKIDRKDER